MNLKLRARSFAKILVFVFGALNSSLVLAADFFHPVVTPLSVCPVTPLQVCGINFVAQAGVPGALVSFAMPDKFQFNSVTFQCVAQGGTPYYAALNGAPPNCTPKSCTQGQVNICGVKIPIQEEVYVDNDVSVSVPPGFLAPDTPPQQFSARCDIINGVLQYGLADASSVSCNAFSCQPATLNACGSPVAVSAPSELGKVIHMLTNDNHSVTVQCVGSNGLAPQYQVTDSDCY